MVQNIFKKVDPAYEKELKQRKAFDKAQLKEKLENLRESSQKMVVERQRIA